MLRKTSLSNVVLPTLFTVVDNIVLHFPPPFSPTISFSMVDNVAAQRGFLPQDYNFWPCAAKSVTFAIL